MELIELDAVVLEHKEKQLLHKDLTFEDFERMKDEGCPVCKAQQRRDNGN